MPVAFLPVAFLFEVLVNYVGRPKPRAMTEVEEKGGQTEEKIRSALTKPTTSITREVGEVSEIETVIPSKKRNKMVQEEVFVKPICSLGKEKVLASSTSKTPEKSLKVGGKQKASKRDELKALKDDNRKFKIDKRFERMQNLKNPKSNSNPVFHHPDRVGDIC